MSQTLGSDGAYAGTCATCGHELVKVPNDRIYHPAVITQQPEFECSSLIKKKYGWDNELEYTSHDVPEEVFVEPDEKKCSKKGCTRRIKNHAWGKIKAEDWFQQKDGDIWCPDHHPEWVAEWRSKKGKK